MYALFDACPMVMVHSKQNKLVWLFCMLSFTVHINKAVLFDFS